MKKISKYLVALAVGALLTFPLAIPAQAYTMDINNYGTGEVQGNVNLGQNVDPKTATTNIINYALTFLALIALVIILIGGFKWMTAAGNEDQVSDAKKLISAGVIGLVIVLAAWGIAFWLIDTISTQVVGS